MLRHEGAEHSKGDVAAQQKCQAEVTGSPLGGEHLGLGKLATVVLVLAAAECWKHKQSSGFKKELEVAHEMQIFA